MRILSVAQIKLKLRGKKFCTLQVKPKGGTKIREIYDLFVSSPSTPFEFILSDKGDGRRLMTLEDTYGLDIRVIRQGNKRIHRKSLWVLAGEWFGSIYIDYTADTEEHMDRLAEARYALQHVDHIENILPEGVHHLSKDSIEILERVAAKGRELAERHFKKDSDHE